MCHIVTIYNIYKFRVKYNSSNIYFYIVFLYKLLHFDKLYFAHKKYTIYQFIQIIDYEIILIYKCNNIIKNIS